MEGFQNIGQRIVEVARLAVAAHLYESVARSGSPESETYRAENPILRPRIATGGAGPSAAEQRGNEPLPRLAHLVTDDERDGLMGIDLPTDERTTREASD